MMRGGRSKKLSYNYLVIGFVLVLLLSSFGIVLFASFGPSSMWEADTELGDIVMNGVTYDDSAVLLSLGADMVGGRRITVDVDGDARDLHDGSWVEYASGGVGGVFPVSYLRFDDWDAGMLPKVSYSVGEFFFTNKDGEKLDEIWREYVMKTVDLGDVHYYFGFSIMFTTRAVLKSVTAYWPYGCVMSLTHDGSIHSENLWQSKYLAELGEVNMESYVDIRVDSHSDFEYSGFINDIWLYDTRARYTILPQDVGIEDTSMDNFNQYYDWEEFNIYGKAEPLNVQNPISIDYSVIDSTVDDDARIIAGATLKPGIDSYGDIVYRDDGPDVYELGGPTVYNVELIYDVVCDISINDVPLNDYTAYWAEGTFDGNFPEEPPPNFISDWIIILIIIVAIIIVMRSVGGKKK